MDAAPAAAPPDSHPQPPAQRVFLALWPEAAVRQQLAAHRACWRWSGASDLYLPDEWHATLHFIGPISRQRLVELMPALAVVPVQPFELVLDTPRLWPRGLAVLCASEVPAALADLHAQLGQQLSRFGLALDPRPFVPHVTLARHAQAGLPPSSSPPLRWPVRTFALVASTGNAAQRYRLLQQWPACPRP